MAGARRMGTGGTLSRRSIWYVFLVVSWPDDALPLLFVGLSPNLQDSSKKVLASRFLSRVSLSATWGGEFMFVGIASAVRQHPQQSCLWWRKHDVHWRCLPLPTCRIIYANKATSMASGVVASAQFCRSSGRNCAVDTQCHADENWYLYTSYFGELFGVAKVLQVRMELAPELVLQGHSCCHLAFMARFWWEHLPTLLKKNGGRLQTTELPYFNPSWNHNGQQVDSYRSNLDTRKKGASKRSLWGISAFMVFLRSMRSSFVQNAEKAVLKNHSFHLLGLDFKVERMSQMISDFVKVKVGTKVQMHLGA